MAWPPAALPTNRTNATPQTNTHPTDHNAIAQAINDTTTKVNADFALFAPAAAGWRGFGFSQVAQTGIQTVMTQLSGVDVTFQQVTGRKYLVIASCVLGKAGSGDAAEDVEFSPYDTGNSATVAVVRNYCRAPGFVTLNAQGIANATGTGTRTFSLRARTVVGYVNAYERSLIVIDVGTGTATPT